MTHLCRAIVARDYAFLAGYASDLWDVAVDADALEALCRPLRLSPMAFESWSDGSWRSWLRNRVKEMGLFSPGHGSCSFPRLLVRLHVGFIRLEETAEMLHRLRRPEPRNESEGEGVRAGPRNRPSASVIYLSPVDRTAARVAPVAGPPATAKGGAA